MKSLKNIMLLIVLAYMAGCQDILDVTPKGIITEDQLSEPRHVEGLVTAAYAWGPQTWALPTLNPWIASLRSDDAYKGGGGLDDQPAWYQMEIFTLVNPNVGNNDGTWFYAYQGISRANAAINAINRMDEDEFPQKTTRLAEMRFIRGWTYFKIKERWRWVPYVDETHTPDDIQEMSNRPNDLTDLQLWQKIADDFKFAADNLPDRPVDKARANSFGAKAFLARTYLWMAYPLDDNHQLTSVDQEMLNQALGVTNEILVDGGFSLADDFSHNFMYEWDMSSPESIWELNFTHDDGTPRGKMNEGNGLTAPWWVPHFSCCDFHKPTFNMVNAFRVNDDGIPMFDDFNEDELNNDYHGYFSRNSFDPRLGHTIAIPGFPWKYQTILYDSTGSRVPSSYGYMHSLKENVRTDSPGLHDAFWMFNAKNQQEARLAEVLLMKAEALIQLDRHNEALPIINQLRERAANSIEVLQLPDGTYPTNYKIDPYIDGVNIIWDKSTAWKAFMFEKRLEFAMEGRRFPDLVRWGIIADVMNAYFEKEETRQGREWLRDGFFEAGRDEFLPIPQSQMNWSQGVYVQNPGY